MRVLITGGTGFIGSALALDHLADGHEVVVLAKQATDAERENAEDLHAAGAEVLTGLITDGELVERACRGAHVVHHIAAAMREANIPDSAFWETNVEATRRLLDAARGSGVRRFVYCSSIGVLGKRPPKPADEQTPCRPQDIYQRTKKAAEDLCLEYQATTGFPIAIVRPADVYGPRDRRLLKLFKAVQSGRFAMIGSGRNEHHLVYVDDTVQGMRLAERVDAAVGQVFILAGEQSVQLAELVRIIAAEVGAAPTRLRIPLAPVWIAGAIVEGLCKPFGIQPPIYRRRVDFFRSDFSFDIAKARRVLGYQPRFDVRRGVAATLRWYRERGLL